jgi:hypothetical protein
VQQARRTPLALRLQAIEQTEVQRTRFSFLSFEYGTLLPLSRDIAKSAIIGPHADDVESGFTTYSYPPQ